MWAALFQTVQSAVGGGKPLSLKVAYATPVVLMGYAAYGLCRSLPSTYRNVRLLMGWRPPSKLDVSPASVTNHGSRAESRFAGSVETAMTMATGQVSLGHYGDNQFRVSGSGWRMDVGPLECLVVPAHVWEEVVSRTGDRVTLRGRLKDCELSDADVVKEEIYTDVFLIKMPPNTFSRIGVSRPTIIPIESKSAAKVAGPAGFGTMGYLALNDRAFGMTWYEGTTLPGYSGAPYTVAGKIAAMHLRGADTQHGPNIGVSAQLLYVTAKKHLDVRIEDSEEWLIQQVQNKKRRIYIDSSWGALDSYRVRIGNQFAIVDKDAFDATVGASWDEYVGYLDYDPTGPVESSGSGNLPSPGALPSLAEPQVLAQSVPLNYASLDINDWLTALDALPTEKLRRLMSQSQALYHLRLKDSPSTSGRPKKVTT